jgi:hypothetical protein
MPVGIAGAEVHEQAQGPYQDRGSPWLLASFAESCCYDRRGKEEGIGSGRMPKTVGS